MKRIALGSDHTGYELKEVIRSKVWADIHVFMDRNTGLRGLKSLQLLVFYLSIENSKSSNRLL
jgi:ribose 5-phosphate isomerase RpiB